MPKKVIDNLLAAALRTPDGVRTMLYADGIRRACLFLSRNKIRFPKFFTYEEAEAVTERRVVDTRAYKLFCAVKNGALVGPRTGFYSEGFLFVNVPVTALPVDNPQFRSWSYPGWKTDRTAMGVVAHEIGHYVADHLTKIGVLTSKQVGPAWRDTLKGKKVSGYEPVPSEAWAESLRLFILNPDLLAKAIPLRYEYIRAFFIPSELRSWQEVLLNHPVYVAAGERWIAR